MKKTIWLLLDDRKGSVNQAQGIAQAIGDSLNVIEKQLVYNHFASLPNWFRGKTLLGINKQKSDNITENFPDAVLSTSRRTVPVARYIRKHSENRTKIIQLMYPSGGVGINEMDLIIVPDHDGIKKQQIPNAMVIQGAPTKICPETMQQARLQWEPIFNSLPRPFTTVIIGGSIKGKAWPLNNAQDLAHRIKELHNKIGGSILITTSRRTGENAQNLIMERLKDIPSYTYIWGEKKENPLMGFYACADRIIVTADSVSMCSEACGTGKPVLLFLGENWLPKKHRIFASSLIKNGYACDLKSPNCIDFIPNKTLCNSQKIAAEIINIIA